MKTLSIAAMGLALAGSAIAQTTVTFPTAATNQEGSSEERRFPFANGISRMMGIYESWDINVPNGSSITSIGFRQELGRASSARAIQLEIYMGPSTTEAGAVSSFYASNYTTGSTPVKVFGPAIVNLPALSSTATTAQEIFVDLTTPYTFDASQNLAIEFRVLANNNGNAAFDYYLDRATFWSPRSSFGTGCPSSAGNTPVLSFATAHIGGTLRASMTNAPASSFVYFNLATTPTTPIPGGPFGAPGCTMYVIPEITQTIQAGSTGGTANFSIPVPLDPNLYQLDVFGQCIIADIFANNLGFVGSNGAQISLGARAPMGSLEASGSSTTTNGTRRNWKGMVTLFKYQ